MGSLQCKAEFRDAICAAVPPLIELLRDQDSELRKSVAFSLGELAKHGERIERW
jgi:HEAT repeat protein